MAILRSLIFYPVFYFISAFLVIGAFCVMPFGGNGFRWMVRCWTDWHRWCVKFILGIKVRIDGELAQGPVLYVIKHESFFEAIDAPTLLDWPAVFTKRELFNIPVWGISAKVYGLIPVARDGGAKALRNMLAEAKGKVEHGRPLVLFPEGTRVPHGDAPALRSGFAGMYKLLKLPVVPVAVNSGPLYHRFAKRSGTITYKIGATVPPGLPRAEAEAKVHAAMNALND